MLELNLKIAWRNLWKNKLYAVINIFGLATGLTGFMMILLYVNKETGYDKWDTSLKNVYSIGSRLVVNGAQTKEEAVKGHFAKLVADQFKEVEEVSLGFWGGKGPTRSYDYNGRKIEISLAIANTSKNFIATYPLKTIYGSFEDVYKTPKGYAISLSKARLFFGNENPINKEISINDGNFNDTYLIKAVWDDQKFPSYFGLDMIGGENFELAYATEFPVRYFNMLVKFKHGTDVKALIPKINELYLQEEAKRSIKNSSPSVKLNAAQSLAILNKNEGISSQELVFEALPDLNLNSYFSTNPKQKSIYILTALASFLIIISCVNFTNLAIVQAAGRAKEVGIKKVLGAFRFNIAKQFLIETGVQCLFAFFIALMFVELLLPTFNEFLATDLSLFHSNEIFKLLLQGFGIVIGVIIISGIYPSIILSGFMPSKILKGNFQTSSGAGLIRKSLIVMQFTIASALTISFVMMNDQVNYMKNKDLGMQTHHILSLNVRKFENRALNPSQFKTIKARLLNIKGVKNLARATDGLIGEGIWKKDVVYNGNKMQFVARYTDLDYFKLIKAKIIGGRDFSKELYATDTLNSVIVNETALKTLGVKNDGIGNYLTYEHDGKPKRVRIIGVVRDIQSEGFEQHIKPTIYLAGNFATVWRSRILLQLETKDIADAVKDISKVWKEIEPEQAPIYSFEDEKFARLSASYERMVKIIFCFGTVTLFVSILGLFALAAYSANIRVKEIAIRKVLGASTRSILTLLNADLVKLVILANALADLFAYIYMSKWFEGFAYHIDISIATFMFVNVVTIAITIITVSMQSMNAVKANPVNALKYE